MKVPLKGGNDMNSLHCCQWKSRARDDGGEQKTWLGRARGVAGVILPGALLALMPKCPMCLAAYVAFCTGFTMSYASAHVLMRSLIALCIGTLAWCVIRRVVNSRHHKQTLNPQPTLSI